MPVAPALVLFLPHLVLVKHGVLEGKKGADYQTRYGVDEKFRAIKDRKPKCKAAGNKARNHEQQELNFSRRQATFCIDGDSISRFLF